MKRLFLLLSVLIPIVSSAQEITQIIRGQIKDQQSGMPMPGASIVLLNSKPVNGTVSNAEGYFSLTGIPVGRQSLQVSMLGYEPVYFNNLVLTSAKELYLEVAMLERIDQLEEVIISSEKKPNEAINEFALVSARQFSVDEATRYAGAWNDPARMATNFAGVSTSGDVRNDIVVRGNSPSNVLYRLEGIPVPNPNHFGTFGGAGGAISMISQNMLANSDFMTGAFPSEYGNVIGGVFDINFRKGNSQKMEHGVQLGMRGIELTTEGPISKKNNASYLANYRYSTLGVFDALGLDIGVPAVPEYQDVSFKIDIPTGVKYGRFSIFGLGGMASINLNDSEVEDPEDFFSQDQPSDIYNITQSGVLGFGHEYFFSQKTSGNLILALSGASDRYTSDTLTAPDFNSTSRNSEGTFEESKLSVFYKLNHKLNSRNVLQGGVLAEIANSNFQESTFTNGFYQRITDYKGSIGLYQVFADWQHRFTDQLSMNIGTHFQYHDLTEAQAIEPRAGIKWAFSKNKSLSFGTGLHSQTLPAYAYFIQERTQGGEIIQKNRNLEFMRSNHYVLGYNQMINPNLRLKVESYYQYLFNIPVEQNASTFSAINTGNNFNGFPDNTDVLINEGTGQNIGVEITLEKFFSKNYYFLLTSSLFDSKYKGSDGVERNTAFNQNYVFNALAGKEWVIGNSDHKILGLNIRLNWTGGRPYIPVNRQLSQNTGATQLISDKAYSEKYNDYFRTDLKLSYTINKSTLAHQVSIDIQNVTNNQNLFQEIYNVRTDRFTREYQQGFLPEIQYKIMF
ncbi:TonB-dependent receptor [Hyphobacterium sp. CCMP332]|nr:TonB-dependent receptor [Hyphobacterium sp. CCMP332]